MKKIILQVLSTIMGLLLINGGLNKFLNYMPVPENLPEALISDMQALMEVSWLMPLVGLAEIIGGILIIIPRMRALGALIIFPVMVGVLLTHLVVDPGQIVIAIVIWAILLWIIFDNREKYLPIIRK